MVNKSGHLINSKGVKLHNAEISVIFPVCTSCCSSSKRGRRSSGATFQRQNGPSKRDFRSKFYNFISYKLDWFQNVSSWDGTVIFP